MDERVKYLKAVPLFAGVDPAHLEEIAAQCVVRRYDAGATVFREGEKGEMLYLVVTGKVAVVKATEAGEVDLATIGPGACFGEMSLFDGAPRSATTKAQGDCELLTLSGTALRPICRRHPELYDNFLKLLSRRLRQMDARLAG